MRSWVVNITLKCARFKLQKEVIELYYRIVEKAILLNKIALKVRILSYFH